MSGERFFVEGVRSPGDVVTLDGSDARKIVTVLRKRSGDTVEIVDSTATAYAARLEIERRAVRVRVLAPMRASAPIRSAVEVTVAQAIPKGQKMDFVVEKLTELGVGSILPFASGRSVVTGSGTAKIERWRRLAHTAAAQCGRCDIPPVEEPLSWNELLARFPSYDRVLFPWELAEPAPLRHTLAAAIEGASRILVVVGPEGGFTHDEARLAAAGGATVLSLGRRILRSETAGLVVLAAIAFLTES